MSNTLGTPGCRNPTQTRTPSGRPSTPTRRPTSITSDLGSTGQGFTISGGLLMIHAPPAPHNSFSVTVLDEAAPHFDDIALFCHRFAILIVDTERIRFGGVPERPHGDYPAAAVGAAFIARGEQAAEILGEGEFE